MPTDESNECSREEFEAWTAEVMGEAPRTVYMGESLRCVAMPMGGIGAGNFALAGDGTLRQWQIFNQVNHTAFLPDTFFAIWTRPGRPGGTPVARLLMTDCFYFEPVASTSDHVIPEEAPAWAMDRVEDIRYVGEYPIAELRYVDEELPVEVSLEAFSPMVPLNAKESGLPAGIFIFILSRGVGTMICSPSAASQGAIGRSR